MNRSAWLTSLPRPRREDIVLAWSYARFTGVESIARWAAAQGRRFVMGRVR